MIGFIPFPRVLVLCEMQSVSSKIWTRPIDKYTKLHYMYTELLKCSQPNQKRNDLRSGSTHTIPYRNTLRTSFKSTSQKKKDNPFVGWVENFSLFYIFMISECFCFVFLFDEETLSEINRRPFLPLFLLWHSRKKIGHTKVPMCCIFITQLDGWGLSHNLINK